jgi:hypothetical protein
MLETLLIEAKLIDPQRDHTREDLRLGVERLLVPAAGHA